GTVTATPPCPSVSTIVATDLACGTLKVLNEADLELKPWSLEFGAEWALGCACIPFTDYCACLYKDDATFVSLSGHRKVLACFGTTCCRLPAMMHPTERPRRLLEATAICAGLLALWLSRRGADGPAKTPSGVESTLADGRPPRSEPPTSSSQRAA